MSDYRSYEPVKPAASKMLAKKWDDRAYEQHQRKLKNVKPSIDTKPPKNYMHVQVKLKKLQMEEERLATIDRDNRRLLEKMSHIMRTKGGIDNKNEYSHKSLSQERRQREMMKITQENQAILGRITKQKPTYSRQTLERDYDKSSQMKESITRFPRLSPQKGGTTASSSAHGAGPTSSSASPSTAADGRSPRKAAASASGGKGATNSSVTSQIRKFMMSTPAEKRSLDAAQDKKRLKELWYRVDYNNNGKISLAELDKAAVQLGWKVSKPALLRAYKKTTLRDGDGDAWVEKKEFRPCLLNIYLFSKLWNIFDGIDTDDDRRINKEEFVAGLSNMGINLTPEQADREFSRADKNGGGQILFREFCEYIGSKIGVELEAEGAKFVKDAETRATKADASAGKADDKFAELEKQIRKDVDEDIAGLWRSLDFNGNNVVSLAEIDKWVGERYPLLNHKPALMRAYKHTTKKDGDGDDWVEKKEFRALLLNLFHFNRVYQLFDVVDSDDDRRLDFGEFKRGLNTLGLKLDDKAAKQEFDKMDRNKGGKILFDEFCAWVANKNS